MYSLILDNCLFSIMGKIFLYLKIKWFYKKAIYVFRNKKNISAAQEMNDFLQFHVLRVQPFLDYCDILGTRSFSRTFSILWILNITLFSVSETGNMRQQHRKHYYIPPRKPCTIVHTTNPDYIAHRAWNSFRKKTSSAFWPWKELVSLLVFAYNSVIERQLQVQGVPCKM